MEQITALLVFIVLMLIATVWRKNRYEANEHRLNTINRNIKRGHTHGRR